MPTKFHVDTTYTLNWQDFPGLVVGTGDHDRNFHLFGLAVCSIDHEPEFLFIFERISGGGRQL